MKLLGSIRYISYGVVIFMLAAAPLSGVSEVIFEDNFMGRNVRGGLDALNWQYWIDTDNIFVSEANDAPEAAPGVLELGPGSTHLGLESEAIKPLLVNGEVTDYRVTVLFVDRLVNGSTDDSDFHIGIRCQEYNPDTEFPQSCYEVEYDGDDNNAVNEVPEEGPTSFHMFIRGGSAGDIPLDHATRDEVSRPVSNVWYWVSIEAQGNTIRAKRWEFGSEEPDWQLEAEDPNDEFPTGGIRIGVWSGLANVSLVRVETVEETGVAHWSLH